MLTPEQIKEARALCDAATDGPWRAEKGLKNFDTDEGWGSVCTDEESPWWIAKIEHGPRPDEDAAFIAASRTLLPAALDTIEARDATIAVLTHERRIFKEGVEFSIDVVREKDTTIAALQAENEGLRKALKEARETVADGIADAADARGWEAGYVEAVRALEKLDASLRAALSPAPQAPESRG